MKYIILFLILVCTSCAPTTQLENLENRVIRLEEQNFNSYSQLAEQYQQLLQKSQTLVEKNYELTQKNKELSGKIQALQNHNMNHLPSENPPTSTLFPFVTIALGDDYSISRTLEPNGTIGITWVIVFDGETVLEKNALNETQYKYFRQDPGIYTIYITAFIDGAYRVISNIISYKIE